MIRYLYLSVVKQSGEERGRASEGLGLKFECFDSRRTKILRRLPNRDLEKIAQ
jgi:hypothetical protein